MFNNLEVTIDWIRHGFSCSNAIYLKSQSSIQNILQKLSINTKLPRMNISEIAAYYAPDAKLTKHGKLQAEQFNNIYKEKINKYDYVLCSELTRAVETALIITKNNKKICNRTLSKKERICSPKYRLYRKI